MILIIIMLHLTLISGYKKLNCKAIHVHKTLVFLPRISWNTSTRHSLGEIIVWWPLLIRPISILLLHLYKYMYALNGDYVELSVHWVTKDDELWLEPLVYRQFFCLSAAAHFYGWSWVCQVPLWTITISTRTTYYYYHQTAAAAAASGSWS